MYVGTFALRIVNKVYSNAYCFLFCFLLRLIRERCHAENEPKFVNMENKKRLKEPGQRQIVLQRTFCGKKELIKEHLRYVPIHTQ